MAGFRAREEYTVRTNRKTAEFLFSNNQGKTAPTDSPDLQRESKRGNSWFSGTQPSSKHGDQTVRIYNGLPNTVMAD